MSEQEWIVGRRCARCGKEIDVLWPHLYRYKRGSMFLCSWSCMRAYDKEKEENMRKRLTLEQKKKAVEIAVGGGSPFDYLKKCGSADAYSAWKKIKQDLKDADPEMFAKLPRRIGVKSEKEEPEMKTDEPDETEKLPENAIGRSAEILDGKIKAITEPRNAEITRPVNYGGFEVMAVKSPKTGFSFESDRKYGMLTWRTTAGDEVCMTADAWHEMARELQNVLRIFGI